MAESSAKERIGEIADELRSLRESGMSGDEVARMGTGLLRKAVAFGAFAGMQYAKLRVILECPPETLDLTDTGSVCSRLAEGKRGKPLRAWDAAIRVLCPDLRKRMRHLESTMIPVPHRTDQGEVETIPRQTVVARLCDLARLELFAGRKSWLGSRPAARGVIRVRTDESQPNYVATGFQAAALPSEEQP